MTLPRRRAGELVWPVLGLTGCLVIVAGLVVAAFSGDLSG